MKNKYQISIVGGGVVGLLTSLALSKQGYEILHIEKNKLSEFSDKRSIALSYSSVAVLNSLDIWKEISQNNNQYINSVHVSDKGHYGRCQLDAQEENLPFLGVIVEMEKLLESIFNKINKQSNIELCFEANVTDIIENNSKYDIQLFKNNNKYLIESNLIIACDGAQSFIRKNINVEADIKDYKQNALVFDIKLSQEHNNVAFERFINHGVIALLPKKNNTMGCVWTVDRNNIENEMSKSSENFLKTIQNHFGFRIGIFKNTTKPVNFPLYLVQSKQAYKKNILFFGNALHFLHPVSGQGLNLSIRDLAFLYDQLKKYNINNSDDLELLLKEFEKERISDKNRTVMATHTLISLFVSDNILFKYLRNFGLHFLQRSKISRTLFSKLMMGKFNKSSTLMRKVVD